jgi:hypothetical protein
MGASAVRLIERFWELMASNDFRSVGSVLADNFVLDWPQSGERIRGRDNYAAMNQDYYPPELVNFFLVFLWTPKRKHYFAGPCSS